MNRLISMTWAIAALVLVGTTHWAHGQAPRPESLPPPAESPPISAATAIPDVEVPAGMAGSVFAAADYLLLQARRRDLDFAIVAPTRSGLPTGTMESVNWASNSGYRVGGGFRSPLSGWELASYYTYFHTSTNRSVASPAGGTLYATVTHPGFIDAVDNAGAGSNLNYNVLDVDIARRFSVSDGFLVRVSAGGRFAWIDQNFNVLYDGQSAGRAVVSSPINFNGAGVRVGADGTWTVSRGFGFYGRMAGSLLAGDFRTRLFEANNGGAAVISDVTDRFRKVAPVAELGIGASWQGEHVQARIGYEITNWFGLVDSPDFVHDFSNKPGRRVSDLSLDGLALQLQFSY